jgi:purine-binding chemotaxis protein CheW
MTTRKLSTFRVADTLFGVAVEDVQEVTRYHDTTPVPLAGAAVRGLMNLRGQVVTVVDLRRRLGYAPAPDTTSSVNLVLRADSGSVSLLVDAVDGFRDVTDAEFTERPETVQGPARDLVLGAYQLTDELLLALDVQRAIDVEA